MADQKISALTADTGLASGDLVPFVDISDTTMAATGTTKKATVTDLMALAPVQSVAGKTGAVTLVPTDAGAAAASHSHAEADVTSLTTDLASKQTHSTKLDNVAALADAAGVLTNNGTGGLSWGASGGGGSSAPRVAYSERWAETNPTTAMGQATSGLGSVSYGGDGTILHTGAGVGAASLGAIDPASFVLAVYDKNPDVSFIYEDFLSAASADNYVCYLTFNYAGNANNPPPATTKYFGLKFIKAAGATAYTVYTVHRDGTNAEVATNVTTAMSGVSAVSGNYNLFYAKLTSGTNIKFYVNGTLMATHTTNLPSGILGTADTHMVTATLNGLTGNTNDSLMILSASSLSFEPF